MWASLVTSNTVSLSIALVLASAFQVVCKFIELLSIYSIAHVAISDRVKISASAPTTVSFGRSPGLSPRDNNMSCKNQQLLGSSHCLLPTSRTLKTERAAYKKYSVWPWVDIKHHLLSSTITD